MYICTLVMTDVLEISCSTLCIRFAYRRPCLHLHFSIKHTAKQESGHFVLNSVETLSGVLNTSDYIAASHRKAAPRLLLRHATNFRFHTFAKQARIQATCLNSSLLQGHVLAMQETRLVRA